MNSFWRISLATLSILLPASLSAQIVNGSFENGFNGFTLSGTPTVVGAPPTPIDGASQALILSTGAAGSGSSAIGNSVVASVLNADLNTTLPGNGMGAAINGEAIRQTFTIAGSSQLSFSYSFQTREPTTDDFDETGYVINGVFHRLANTTSAGVSASNAVGPFARGLPYQLVQLTLNPGTYTLGFVAYNTGNTNTISGIYLDDIFLTSLVPPTPVFHSIANLTPNQSSIATNIDHYSTTVLTGNFATLVTGLTNLVADSAAIASALNQISPQALQVFTRAAVEGATFTSAGVDNHLANLRDGLTGFDGSQMSVSNGSDSPALSQIKGRLLAWNTSAAAATINDSVTPLLGGVAMSDVKEMKAVSASQTRISTFVSGSAVLADLSHDGNLAHQDYTTGSVTLGADYRIDSHFTVGGMLGYSHTDADLDHADSSATIDSYSPGIYASLVDGGWYTNALFAYDYNSYTSDRRIDIGALNGFNHGATTGNEFVANLSNGYEFHTGAFKYGPTAGLRYVNVGIDGFTEDGPTSLTVHDQSAESLRSQFGLEGRFTTRVGSVVLTPHLSAAWQHEFLDGSRSITAQFSQFDAAPFSVQTTDVGRDSAFIDCGLDATVARDIVIFGSYQTDVGADHYFAQSIQAGLKIGF